MEQAIPSRRIHPLVACAAISVILVSLTGVAAITGFIPESHGTAGSTAIAAATTDAMPTAESTIPKAEEKAEATTIPAVPAVQKRQKTAQAPAICQNCGKVTSIQAVQEAAPPSGVGMVAGAVLGGVIGNQVGGGNGRKLATVAGAIGGGYAGNEVEKRTRTTTTYQVHVRMENGGVRTFQYAQRPAWSTGDRVRVVNGQLSART